VQTTEINFKYSGYIEREKLIADKIKRLEKIRINSSIDFKKLKSLSTEARQKLTKIKPETIGQASRISGISPADINVLLVYMGR
jgi:tRNA uridine 5-carboxymethylaminomethyl modification enzyme